MKAQKRMKKKNKVEQQFMDPNNHILWVLIRFYSTKQTIIHVHFTGSFSLNQMTNVK